MMFPALSYSEPQPAITRRDPATMIAAVAALAAAIAVSSFRVVLAPGFEFYLGPLFYLLAYRAFGLRAGLVVAVAVTLPSYWWWGSFAAVPIACAHLIFIDRTRARGLSLAGATLLFHALLGGPLIGLVMGFRLHATMVAIGTSLLRKVMLDLALATIVDFANLFLALDARPPRIAKRRTVSLAQLVEVSTMLLLSASTLILFLSDIRQFNAAFDDYRGDLHTAVLLELRDAPLPHGDALVTRTVKIEPLPPQPIVFSAAGPIPAAELARRFNCTHTDAPNEGADPVDRRSLPYWYTACGTGSVVRDGRTLWFASAVRPLAEQAYREILIKMLGLAGVLLLALLVQAAINRALHRALKAWSQAVHGLGQPHLATPRGIVFTEFEEPVSSYIAANNRYSALVDERATLARSVAELKGAIDLKLMRDVRYDEQTHRLVFTEVDLEIGARPATMTLHPNDAVAFANAANNNEALVEFRLADSRGGEWYALLAHDPAGPNHWRSGCCFRLRRTRVTDPSILHQARLIELGGMASALSHELRQPLFTISLAAENGSLICDGDMPDPTKIKPKFERVLEQVERASAIIQRISGYARVEAEGSPPVPLIEAINAAAKFMRPLLVARNVQLRVQRNWEGRHVTAPRVALEQILVNAIQNGIDAIDTYRNAHPSMLDGVIEIALEMEDGCARIRVTDNGTGLDPAVADDVFDAFLTTKPAGKGTGLGLYICRQIMSELSGGIDIRSRPAPDHGAILTLYFPRQEPPATTPRLMEQQV